MYDAKTENELFIISERRFFFPMAYTEIHRAFIRVESRRHPTFRRVTQDATAAAAAADSSNDRRLFIPTAGFSPTEEIRRTKTAGTPRANGKVI